MYDHTCKCGASYTSDDPEPYLCEACIAERKAIAAEVDRKHQAQGPSSPVMSELQIFDSLADRRGFAKASELANVIDA